MCRKEDVWLAVLVTLGFVCMIGTVVWLSHVKSIDKAGYHYR